MKPINLKFLIFVACWLTACATEPPQPTVTLEPTMQVAEFVTQAPAPTATPRPTATVGVASPTLTPTLPITVSVVITRAENVNPLTGLVVSDTALIQRQPLMVRVGNDPEARPQVSLDKADMVYEELTEWWITRFSAIYLTHDPETIAPIRSVRLSNLQLAPQYQAALAHSGGSDPVRWELSQSNIVNLDEFFTPKPYFYRENQGWQTRLAFNAVTARAYMAEEELTQTVKLRGFAFSDKLETPFPAAQEVVIPYPPTTSEATWKYDSVTQRYLRWTTDEPLTNFEGQQISAANVIIYFADHQKTDIVEDSTGATSIRIILNGEGTAWVIRDGQILQGTWATNGQETPTFTLANGQPMPLKPGNSWVEVVPLTYKITIDGQTLGRQDPLSATPAPRLTPTP